MNAKVISIFSYCNQHYNEQTSLLYVMCVQKFKFLKKRDQEWN